MGEFRPGEAGVDGTGIRREIFDPDASKVAIRDVFANLTPAQTSAITAPVTADIYVVNRQEVRG